MEQTTNTAAERVNKHREDGEEALKRTGKVVPIDEGTNRESVQVTPESQAERNKSLHGESE